MTVRQVTARQLAAALPGTECCGCQKEPDEAPRAQIWIIVDDSLIYCPQCARDEGIEPG